MMMVGENENEKNLPQDVENIIKSFSKPFGLRLNYKSTFPNHRHAIVAHLIRKYVLIVNDGVDQNTFKADGINVARMIQRNEWIPTFFYASFATNEIGLSSLVQMINDMKFDHYDWNGLMREILEKVEPRNQICSDY
jgi:hypothetical protein